MNRKITELDSKLRAVLARLIESWKERSPKENSVRALADKIGYDDKRLGAWLNEKQPGMLGIFTYASALRQVGVDMLDLLEFETQIMTGDGLSEPVRRFLTDPRTGPAATRDELRAIVALARTGWFDGAANEAEIVEFWIEIRERAANRKP